MAMPRRLVRALIPSLVALSGCAPPPPPPGPPSGVAEEPPPPPKKTEADLMFPPPFTADQIRDATPVGRTYRFKLLASKDATVHVEMAFVEVTDEGCTVEERRFDAKDKPVGEPKRREATWKELEGHARYPKEGTIIKETDVVTPAGTFDAIVYTMTEIKNGRTWVTRAAFAKDLPGMPVKLEIDDNGITTDGMVLVAHQRPE